MPHSSGGGSHGGGSHGGRGGSSSRTSSRPFRGSRRFVYYRNRMPVEVYANYDVSKGQKASWITLIVMSAFIMLVAVVVSFIGGVHAPRKLEADYDTDIVINDGAGIISEDDEAMLRSSLEDFYDETGIAPAVFTVNNSDWESNYHHNLERYSYDIYVNNFKDEKHWLIVYSEPKEPDEDFNDWYWEGMQGDLTDNVLTQTYANRFNKKLQKNLLKSSDMTVGEAIADAFDELTPVIMRRYIDWLLIIVLNAIWLPIFAVMIGMGVKGLKKDKIMKNAVECSSDEVIEQIACSYCGGIYVKGHHTTCPHCAAQVNE